MVFHLEIIFHQDLNSTIELPYQLDRSPTCRAVRLRRKPSNRLLQVGKRYYQAAARRRAPTPVVDLPPRGVTPMELPHKGPSSRCLRREEGLQFPSSLHHNRAVAYSFFRPLCRLLSANSIHT